MDIISNVSLSNYVCWIQSQQNNELNELFSILNPRKASSANRGY